MEHLLSVMNLSCWGSPQSGHRRAAFSTGCFEQLECGWWPLWNVWAGLCFHFPNESAFVWSRAVLPFKNERMLLITQMLC